MHQRKYIPFLVCAALLLLIGPSSPSHPAAPGQDFTAPFTSPGTNPAPQEAGGNGTPSDERLPIGMVPDETHAGRGIHIPIQADLDLSEPTASFEIEYVPVDGTDYRGVICTTFPEEAKGAFEHAAAIWAATIHSTVPITIRACWALSLGSLLGYSGSGSEVNFIGAPEPDTYYSRSLANALRGEDLDPSYHDMNITYNSIYPYYFGTDGNPDEDEYDFVTLALHEIGHGLNFSGIVYYNTETGEGFIGSDSGYHSRYDDFMYFYDRDEVKLIPLTSYTSPSVELGTKLRSEDLYFLGENAIIANGGESVKMYAPVVWKPGSSYVHLDYETFKDDPNNSLMVYAMSDGYANHDSGAVTRGLLMDLGWPDRLEPYPPGIVWASDDTFTDKVRISWILPSSATTYHVFRNTTADPETAFALTPTTSDSPFDDFTAVPETTYYYWVRACNTAGCSDLSDWDQGRRSTTPVPEAPQSVNASNGTDPDNVYITWDDPEGATYYKVYRDSDNVIGGNFFQLLADNVIGNSTTDTPLVDFVYYYWVRACNASGCSGYSEPDQGYITPTKPLPPANLEASDGTDKDNVYLSWDPSAGDKIYYMIYRNTTDDSSKAELLEPTNTTTTYVDTTAAPQTDYYYWVRACDSGGCSGYSYSDLGFREKSPPEKPLGVTASQGDYPDRVHLYWNESAHTDYYQIFRNTSNTPTDAIEMENRHPINSYDDLQVVTGITYYYFVKACNAEGCSSYSSSASGYSGSKIFLPLVQSP